MAAKEIKPRGLKDPRKMPGIVTLEQELAIRREAQRHGKPVTTFVRETVLAALPPHVDGCTMATRPMCGGKFDFDGCGEAAARRTEEGVKNG